MKKITRIILSIVVGWFLLGNIVVALFFGGSIGNLVGIVIAIVIYFATAPKKEPPVPIDDTKFKEYCATLNSTAMHNLIISGGDVAGRFLAITGILNVASVKRIPTIVLHSGFDPFHQFSQNTYYDPCIGKESEEIAEIFTDAASNALAIDSVIHSSIKLIADILQAENGDITLNDIIRFPYDDVLGHLDECKDNGSISDEQYGKLKQRYNNPAIKDNMLRIAPLFQKLRTLARKNSTSQPVNFQQSVANRQILFFDLLSDTNAVLKELVFSEINKLTETHKFWVVTEGISFMENSESNVNAVLAKNRNNISLFYSGEDVPALASQTENIFHTLVSGNTKLLLFAHTSAVSAEKWSGHFGKENVEKITTGRNVGWRDTTDTRSTTTEKDYAFPPQVFMKSVQTRDTNNNTVVLGLNDNQGYFIERQELSFLPIIQLQPTPLMLEKQAI